MAVLCVVAMQLEGMYPVNSRFIRQIRGKKRVRIP